MTKRHLVPMIAAIGVGGGLALAVPALPAVGDASPPSLISVELGNKAKLLARGAGVSLRVEITCPAGSIGFLSTRVTERVGRGIASGFGGVGDVLCTGAPQVVRVNVNAEGQGGLAFKTGPALAEATFSTCSFFCSSASDSERIRIIR